MYSIGPTIYVQYLRRRWEAEFWSEDRCFRFTSWDRSRALAKCVKATGYRIQDCKIVTL